MTQQSSPTAASTTAATATAAAAASSPQELPLTLTYPGWELDKEQAERLFLEYSSTSTSAGTGTTTANNNNHNNDCFRRKLDAMKNKQRLFEGDRSHPELVALDACQFTYIQWQTDAAECVRRHVGDCSVWHLGAQGFWDALDKMKRRQLLVSDARSSHNGLLELDSAVLTYEGWHVDKAQAEQLFVDYSTATTSSSTLEDCFAQKVRAMKNKQRLLVDGDDSHDELQQLKAAVFTYEGWQDDKDEAIRRHVGDCKTFQLGTSASWLAKMHTKQQLHDHRASIPGLVQLDAATFTYEGWQIDKALCEKYLIDYSHTTTSMTTTTSTTSSRDSCFDRKFKAMQVKQRLAQGDRSSDPEIIVLDATAFTYEGWQADKREAERRLTGDCILLHMGTIGFQEVFYRMKKKQALHVDRNSIACLRDLDAMVVQSTTTVASTNTGGGGAGTRVVTPPPTSSSSVLSSNHSEHEHNSNVQIDEEHQLFRDALRTDGSAPSEPTPTTNNDDANDNDTGVSSSDTGLANDDHARITAPLTGPQNNNTHTGHQNSVARAMANADNKCVVCLENQPSHAYIPCGHLCVCGSCVARYDAASSGSCPICRKRFHCVIKIYC